MKYPILFSTFMFLPFLLSAQLYPLKPQADSIAFSVVSKDGNLHIQYEKLPEISDFAEITAVKLVNGDLIMEYKYNGKNSSYTPDVVKIIGLKPENDKVIFPQEGEINQSEVKITEKRGMKGKLEWLDATEKSLYLGQSYLLIIERNIRLDIDCEKPRPEFGLKQTWPHYAGTASGIIAIGVGQLFRKKKEDAYDAYKDIWIKGGSESDAQPDLDDAKKYDTNTKIFTYAGIGILAANTVWYIIHRKNVKENQKLYDEYCLPNTTTTFRIQPTFEIEANQKENIGSTIGLQVLVRF